MPVPIIRLPIEVAHAHTEAPVLALLIAAPVSDLRASACAALSGETIGTLRWYSCACDHCLAGLVRWLVVASVKR